MKTALISAAVVLGALAARTTALCRVLPGDAGWPDAAAWAALNETINGLLVATVPIGHVCHDPTYDADACAALQQGWTRPMTHLGTSSSVMQPFFANQSCDPFTEQSKPCQLDNYVSYAVNVSSAADIQAAVRFATKNNIRLVVRNTGHDYFGRSTGAGALAIWTHHFNNIDFIRLSDSSYSGTAMKVGAGVMGYQAVEAADAAGLVAVTGECPTVGLAGFTMGAGHSALSSSFGLGADQVLEYEVVTADGQIVTASPTQNSDLYWALSGGGPGTFGVVASMTVRTYPAALVGGASIALSAAYTTPEKFQQAFAALHALLPNMTDLGAHVIYTATNTLLQVSPVTVFNSTGEYVKEAVLGPFTARLAALGIPFSAKYTTLSYRDHYATYLGPLPNGNLAVSSYQFGSRLIPRSVLLRDNAALQTVLQNLTSHGVILAGSAADYRSKITTETTTTTITTVTTTNLNTNTTDTNATALTTFRKKEDSANAVLPQWRDATVQLQLITRWDSAPSAWPAMLADQRRMTEEYVPQLESVTPNGGAYVNEADFRLREWKRDFFGNNYGRLMSIKNTWDKEGVFWVLKGVGSDRWAVDGEGRLCRTDED
ncbi:FAD-binding domain-containing protein [Parathielavia hyrcaniae]|uniref:FAD-binding domain-containing protein n=1 Tax=Parathielavia hyrcaniae TaxID=113614 RepID=A0AAN6Q2N4_9PEZI|nr:FAD-binding domain-containing protein [Parathielavia hyrcaniae]